jgi:signal transduction histidine kinase
MQRKKSDLSKNSQLVYPISIISLIKDVICHELRNPLNGIYHNADIVSESVTSIREQVLKLRDDLFRTHKTNDLSNIEYSYQDSQTISHLVEFLDTELAQDLESLESLNLCAKHQKRIADDVLQMSKLSMNLVSLTVTQFDPFQETRNVIRMFEREAFVKNIAFKFTIREGYRNHEIGWVSADPIRFSQVLLNFISNAVRFTEKVAVREIEISLDASEVEPTFPHPLVGSNDASRPELDAFADENNRVYLIVSVADSGVGLTPDERANLFQKFAQASPRTHIEYGGSGLGLFISKSLVEVQGGRISLESEKDKGTTLTFYIQATQVATPVNSTAPSTSSRSISPRITTPKIKRSSSSTTSIPQIKAIKVLVVEDNLVTSLAPAELTKDQSKSPHTTTAVGRIQNSSRESRNRVSGNPG